MSDEILIDAENLGKKFCRSLKRSLWYGIQDIAKDLSPFNSTSQLATQNPQPTTSNSQPTTNNSPALRAEEFWALQNVSFQLRRGECLGLIGHNGAGKSTLLKILNGLIRPDTGRLVTRGRIGALIELSAGFNPVLTGRENVYNRGALLGFSREEIARKFEAIVDFAELGDFIDMPVQHYSSGMQVRLGFAVSSQMEPDVLILDEVLAVGDIAFRFKCINAMAEMLRNSAVIFVSHSLPQIYRISSQVMVLDHGKVVFHGRNVAAGIEHYHSLQKATEANVTGSGEAFVRSCELVSEQGSTRLGECLDLAPSEPFQIRLLLGFSGTAASARVQAVLWNQEMLPVADIMASDAKGFLVRRPPGEDTVAVSVEVPGLPLNGGNHALSICIVSEDQSRVYCRHDNAATLRVSNSTASGAHFIIAASWEQTDAPLVVA
jgi:lipopolysaccharide transport system ATP-binding protein